MVRTLRSVYARQTDQCASHPGRNKLLINHLGKLFVTSDAATIIREVEVVHPAAKLLVMASQAQESEVRNRLSSAQKARLIRAFLDGRRDEHGHYPGGRDAEEGGASVDHGSAPK